MRKLTFLLISLVILAAACHDKPPAPKPKVEKDPRVAAAEDKINKTTPEGKAIIEKVQGMKPEVNEVVSTKTLKEISDDYSQNKGAYNITPIGWEASQKKSGRWKVVYYYQDWQKQFLTAEWEYDPQASKVYPFEKTNAPQFHSTEGATPAAKKGK